MDTPLQRNRVFLLFFVFFTVNYEVFVAFKNIGIYRVLNNWGERALDPPIFVYFAVRNTLPLTGAGGGWGGLVGGGWWAGWLVGWLAGIGNWFRHICICMGNT